MVRWFGWLVGWMDENWCFIYRCWCNKWEIHGHKNNTYIKLLLQKLFRTNVNVNAVVF